jgi:hypothetical protein
VAVNRLQAAIRQGKAGGAVAIGLVAGDFQDIAFNFKAGSQAPEHAGIGGLDRGPLRDAHHTTKGYKCCFSVGTAPALGKLVGIVDVLHVLVIAPKLQPHNQARKLASPATVSPATKHVIHYARNKHMQYTKR